MGEQSRLNPAIAPRSFVALVAGAFAIVTLSMLAFAGLSSAATWSTPAQVETTQGGFGQNVPDAALSDGTTAVSWIEFDNTGPFSKTSLVTKRVNREGTAIGGRTVVAALSDTSGVDNWFGRTAAAAGDGGTAVFAWVEHSRDVNGAEDVNGYSIKTRTVDAAGNLGAVNTLSQSQLAENVGQDTPRDLTLNSNGGTLAAGWNLSQARGNDCGSYYSSTNCVVHSVTQGVGVSQAGAPTSAVQTLQDVVSDCSSSAQVDVVTAPDGTSTVIWTICRIQGGNSGHSTYFQRLNNAGTVGGPGFIVWTDGYPYTNSGVDSAGVVSVSIQNRVYRIKADGSVVPPALVADSGENDNYIDSLTVRPDGTTTASWSSYRDGGAGGTGLKNTVWTRQLMADGTVAPPNAIVSRDFDEPANSYGYFYYTPELATGDGTASGVIGVESDLYTQLNDPPYTEARDQSIMAGELDAAGALATSQAIAGPRAFGSQISVSADGTGALSFDTAADSPYRETAMVSKLPRTATCGIISSLCKAKLGFSKVAPKKGRIKAGKKLKVKVTVKNSGDASADGVTVSVKSFNKKVKAPKKVKFGNIDIGASVTKTITLKAKGKAKGKAKVKFKVASSSKTVKYNVKSKKKHKKKKHKKKK